ncbi:DJ-1/PfpI family protein [Catalinimonas sp. 4WD22]|uniref:DJ-1/PfpI family protein n=1 Tax=Catalinimonas locisalis TaxID=3133978 RepID=UPI003101B461
MKTIYILIAALFYMSACDTEMNKAHSGSTDSKQKVLQKGLPVIGLLMYEGVLTTEVTAPLDVFAKPSEEGEQLFNVITIAPTAAPIVSEEGLEMQADFTFENAPQVDVLFVPSAYDMYSLVRNDEILAFIRTQNQHTAYTVSNCAGAQLIGASGIADGKKIVTWIGGGKELQENYPALKVQDDLSVSYVEDGKFLSANGNLASYISSLELLEKMTDHSHRKYVESYLYLDRLRQWAAE